jgi:aryl-alcohol dehydrogenase-like predicted oxidoreductase
MSSEVIPGRLPQACLGDCRISRIGFGAFPLSNEGRPADEASIRVIHRALDAGVTLIDTADSYHLAGAEPGHGEDLVRRALAQWGGSADTILVSTKGGRAYGPDKIRYCVGRPEQIRAACEASLRRLGRERIDLYYFHRPDPAVPYAESVGALRQLHAEGKIRWAGISNVNIEQIGVAHETLGPALLAVQNEFSPWFRSSEDELALAERLGLFFFPWSPFGGADRARRLSQDPTLSAIAAKYAVSAHQVVLAWMLTTSPHLVPIPGARRVQTLLDSLAAAELRLEPADLEAIEGLRLENSSSRQ